MDETLHNRWKSSRSPFHGNCIHVVDEVSVSTLRETLVTIAGRLRDITGEQPLLLIDDWHQHDGFITDSIATNWAGLLVTLESDASLVASRHGDFYVRAAIYPRDLSFLLRYYVDDEELPMEPTGDFDLSASDEVLDDVRNSISDRLRGLVAESNAKEYFDRIYGG